ncbi:MAG: hypothetical protein ACSLFA_05005 [Mycobacterium sp.]
MTPFLRVIDRLTTATVAGILLAGAALVIGYGANVTIARDLAAGIDTQAIARAPEWSWWSAALGVAGAIAVLLGLWLLLMRVRPRSVRDVATAKAGSVDLARIADAAADDLGRHPSVQSAHAVTRTVSGRPVARVTVEIPASTSPAQVRRIALRCGEDVHRAAGADVEFQLLVKPVPADKVRPGVA